MMLVMLVTEPMDLWSLRISSTVFLFFLAGRFFASPAVEQRAESR
jgi:hypothetical protein